MKAKEKDEWEVTITDVFRYYIAWTDTDEELVKCIKENNLNNFIKYLKAMKIKRNFKKGSDNKVFEKAKKYKDLNPQKPDVEKFSTELYKAKLLAGHNKNAIVAASKILWILNMGEIIIQDSRAKRSLEKLTGKKIPDYEQYCINWEKQYQIFRPLYISKIQKEGIEKFNSVFNEEWFIRRTFDNYLWSKGKSENKNEEE